MLQAFNMVEVKSSRSPKGLVLQVEVGLIGIIDLGLDKFPGMPAAAIESKHLVGGHSIEIEGNPSLTEISAALAQYFTVLAASEPSKMPET